jgi:hypothetical protein
MICDFARNLGEAELTRISALEQDLGLLVVAFSCRSLDEAREERIRAAMAAMGPLLQAEPADADEAQLRRIRETEESLGLSLVAVRA